MRRSCSVVHLSARRLISRHRLHSATRKRQLDSTRRSLIQSNRANALARALLHMNARARQLNNSYGRRLRCNCVRGAANKTRRGRDCAPLALPLPERRRRCNAFRSVPLRARKRAHTPTCDVPLALSTAPSAVDSQRCLCRAANERARARAPNPLPVRRRTLAARTCELVPCSCNALLT